MLFGLMRCAVKREGIGEFRERKGFSVCFENCPGVRHRTQII